MALQLAHVSGQRVTVRNLPTRVLAQVPCWERRRTPSHRDGDGDRDRDPARHRIDVRRPRAAARDPLPLAAASVPPTRPLSPRALSDTERAAILSVLHEPRFVDLAPAEVYATLLDEGRYLCFERTMYRLSRPTRRCGSGGINSGIPATRLRNFWPAGPTSWTAPAAGVPRPSRDQSTQGAGTLAGLIAYPATPTCPQGHLCVACGRSRRGHACHQQGEADAAACEGCKAREG
jgi:hypothetical protein